MVEPRPSGESKEPPDVKTGRSVPLKWVLSGVGGLVVLGLTFYGGMAYENHRISSAISDAFSGLDTTDGSGPSTGNDADSGDDDADAAEPVELVQGQPVETNISDGDVTITLLDTTATDSPAVDDTLSRNLRYTLRVENTGEQTVSPSISAHFEGDSGKVYDFAGVFCDQDSMPSDDIEPGQFVQGCNSDDLAAESGKLVFDYTTPELYISVPAA